MSAEACLRTYFVNRFTANPILPEDVEACLRTYFVNRFTANPILPEDVAMLAGFDEIK
ncbi:hypothetical protein DPMN_172625 [Dreissena polymorpha]|uniref:Uncharacterized protein n=1 Tax=Dreissena polymorpha TaxID=45954 RepID=A0A9D4E2Q1_DREPO|nr:hypothetical protein DPMN_172625 [Dreissena polymorpha]